MNKNHIVSNFVTPLDRLWPPSQYAKYRGTRGAMHPVQIPALYIPSEMRPMHADRFTNSDYQALLYLDNKDTQKDYGITKQPEISKEYFKMLDKASDDDQEITILKQMINEHPDIFFPIMRRIRLLHQYDEVSQYCINFMTYETDYSGRSGLATLHSMTFETVGIWSSDFEEIAEKNYNPKLVVVEESVSNLEENISKINSEYDISSERDERTIIHSYAKNKEAVLIVRLKGKAENHHISWANDYWLPDAVVAAGDKKDHYRPRAFITPDDSLFVGNQQMIKWGPIRKWLMNQETIHSAYKAQYPIAKEKQMLDREELKLFSPEHYNRLAPMDPRIDMIMQGSSPDKLESRLDKSNLILPIKIF